MQWTKQVEITPGFCILWAFLLLTQPLELLAAAMGAACFHELCHAGAVGLLGGRIHGITVRAGGMIMEIGPLPSWKETVCALAGPAGSFLLLPLAKWFPLLSLCGFIQGCFNLLPLYPLDGGRALACVLRYLCPAGWVRVQSAVEWTALALLLLPAAGCGMGIGPVLVWGMAAIRKIPCKQCRFGVQ